MPRFTDIESTTKRLPPVYGYLTHQLLPLQEALDPISSQIDQLDRFRKIANNECHFPSEHGLTREESAAIFLYTMEWGENSFYQVINRALHAEDRSTLKPWFAYLKLFDTAIQKLPTVRMNLWRGVARNISKNYKKGDEFTWWTISSCSTSVDVIKNFLGANSTLFLIEAVNGKDVCGYTNYPNENEVILSPGTRLHVVSDPLDQPPMHLVHLKEVSDDTEQQLATSFSAMAMAPSSKTASSGTTPKTQSSAVKIHTYHSGNRYEGEMKDGKRHGKGKMDYASGDSYIGIWVDDSKTGQGVYISASGNRYEGQFKNNKMHGKGKIDFASGGTYTGDWIDSDRTGQGIYIFSNGDRYEGQWKDGKRHGKGKKDFASGDMYTGDWIDGDRTGQGIYIFANGDRYEGQFKNSKMHGKGKIDFARGGTYTGDWIDGDRTGQGIYIFANGDRYEGQWKNGKMHGKGKIDFANGDTYTGDWIDDHRTGQGIYIFANGNRYEGQFKNNKMHGKGKKDFASGDTYTGDWIDDHRTGQGICIYANGNRYEGQWEDGKRHGKGKMTRANGTVKDGMWSNGDFVG